MFKTIRDHEGCNHSGTSTTPQPQLESMPIKGSTDSSCANQPHGFCHLTLVHQTAFKE